MSYHYGSSSSSSSSSRVAATRLPAPPGYHYMPDGSLMLDSEMTNEASMSTAVDLSTQARVAGTAKSVTLKARLKNSNIIIDQVSSAVNRQSNVVEVLIMPKTGYKIQPEDFSTGYLPRGVARINFEKEKDFVIAVVTLIVDQLNNNNNVIELPISAKVRATHHEVQISENIQNNSDIIATYITRFPVSKVANTITYKVKNELGKKTLIFTRRFTVVSGSEFSKKPSFSINKNKERFDIVTKSTKRTVEFRVYYSSPADILDHNDVESIVFSTSSRKVKSSESARAAAPIVVDTPQGYGQAATTITYGSSNESVQEESGFKIYSFDPGRKIGSSGGIRKIKIKGVPGTPFKLMLQDSNFKTYNFASSTYEEGGGMLEAKIPRPRMGLTYGEYIASVKVPRSISAISYSDRLIKDIPIDHTKIQSVALANLETTGKANILTEVKVSKAATVTFGLDVTGGFLTSFVPVALGPGDLGSSIIGGTYAFKVNAPAGHSISVARQPLEAKAGAKFTAWTSGDKTTLLSAGSSGTVIQNDWSNTRVVAGNTESSSIIIKTSFGSGDGRSVKGTINISTTVFGEANNIYKLKLLNFLTLTSL